IVIPYGDGSSIELVPALRDRVPGSPGYGRTYWVPRGGRLAAGGLRLRCQLDLSSEHGGGWPISADYQDAKGMATGALRGDALLSSRSSRCTRGSTARPRRSPAWATAAMARPHRRNAGDDDRELRRTGSHRRKHERACRQLRDAGASWGNHRGDPGSDTARIPREQPGIAV